MNSRPALPSPDVTALASYEMPAGSLSGAGPYRVLKPFDAQCAAAAHCPLANALEYESGIVASQAGMSHGSRLRATIHKQSLAYRAADERNHAAGQALEVFYLLAEAEASRDRRPQQQADRSHAGRGSRPRIRGVRVEKGAAEFRRQQLEMSDRQAELQLSLAQANSRLRQFMGLCPDETVPIWPEADWTVTVPAINANAVVCDGLCRARGTQSAALMLRQNLDADSSDTVGSIVELTIGATGGSRAADCLFRTGADDIDGRRGQLDDYLARQELAPPEEIRMAVFTIDIRLQQIANAKRKVDFFRDQSQMQRLMRQRPRQCRDHV